MNKELSEIVSNHQQALAKLPKHPISDEYKQLNRTRIRLQKELLNASVVGLPTAETEIKDRLKEVEYQLLKTEDSRILNKQKAEIKQELNYLVKLIREKYE